VALPKDYNKIETFNSAIFLTLEEKTDIFYPNTASILKFLHTTKIKRFCRAFLKGLNLLFIFIEGK